MALTLLAHASVPLKFWDEACLTAVFLINRLPSKVINDQTPFERLFGHQPDYSFLRTFGCAVWPNLRPYNSKKLQFRSKRCVFLGYNNLHKGFKCLEPNEGRVYISRDVTFDETIFPFAELHPNAGARLRSEILLFAPDSMAASGDNSLNDQHVNLPANLSSYGGDSSLSQVPNTGEVTVSRSSTDAGDDSPLNSAPESASVQPPGSSPQVSAPTSPGRQPIVPAPAEEVVSHEDQPAVHSSPPIAAPAFGVGAPSPDAATRSPGEISTGGSSTAGTSEGVTAPARPVTRLQHGIQKKKIYTDGTIRYGMLASTGEPTDLADALQDKKLETGHEL